MNNFKVILESTSDSYWLKRTHLHGLESNAIVKLFTPLFIKFKSCLQKRLLISKWESTSFLRPNIREYSRRVCTDIPSLPVRNKAIFAEDSLHKP